MRALRYIGFLAIAGCCLVTAGPATGAKRDWQTFGYDGARSGWFRGTARIGAGDLKSMRRQDITLPGTVDSAPLYLHALRVKARTHDVFVVETSYGRVVALDAGSGKILWTYTPPSYDELAGGGEYSPATPVVDPKRRFVYSTSADGYVRKVALATGTEVLSDDWPAKVTLDSKKEKLSSSLNLASGHVIATTAGYGEPRKPLQGHVVYVDSRTGALAHNFNSLCSDQPSLIDTSTCPETASGIWARQGAVVVPGSHRLLVATGNGDWNGKTDWGDSVLSLSPAGKLLDNWTPRNQTALEHFDADLGSTAPALVRWRKRWLGVQSGKDGDLRLLDIDNLNGHGHACHCKGNELQRIHTEGDIGVYSAPAAWRHDGHGWVFVTTYEDTTAYRVAGKHPKLHRVWRKPRAGSSPVIAGGLLYVFDPVDGGVFVYRPATGRRVGKLPSAAGHWNSPIVADGRVAIPVGSAKKALTTGTLTIYRRP